jgi:hypothetical protein
MQSVNQALDEIAELWTTIMWKIQILSTSGVLQQEAATKNFT